MERRGGILLKGTDRLADVITLAFDTLIID